MTTEYTPGGDMTDGTAYAHVETPAEMAANPIEDDGTSGQDRKSYTDDQDRDNYTVDEPVGSSYTTQHAKVVRFEISVGKDDDNRSLEEFERDMRLLLLHGSDLVLGEGFVPPHNVTMQGGYYLIDGTVCLAVDYDPSTKNRKPGTFPPSWAGGPNGSQTVVTDYTTKASSPVVGTRQAARKAAPTKVTDPTDAVQTVAELAGGMVDNVKKGTS